MTASPAARVAESVGVAVAGAAAGWLAGFWIHPVVGDAMALVGLANGAVSGWRGIYPWRRASGWLAFLLDSTWAAFPVLLSLVAHVVALVRHGEPLPAFSRRTGHHVYRGGLTLKKRFALTIGNVVSGAADVERASRAQLVTDHEAVHVWQARWFGPLYVPIYLLWWMGGALAATVVWLRRGRRVAWGALAESYGYYMNPFEWWAYSREGNWPPHGLRAGSGWKGAIVRSFAERAAGRPGSGSPHPS